MCVCVSVYIRYISTQALKHTRLPVRYKRLRNGGDDHPTNGQAMLRPLVTVEHNSETLFALVLDHYVLVL